MKKIFLYILIVFSIFISQTSISDAQSWQELMDSSTTYHQVQDFETSIKWGEKALEKARNEIGDLDTNIADIASFLTYLNWSLGKYETALIWAKMDSTIRVNSQSREHPRYRVTLLNLGAQYVQLSRFNEAENANIESLNLARKIFKGDHPDLASSINSMAMFYNARGNYKDSEPLFKEALEMKRRIFKGDHHDLARSINNMAWFYNGRGNYKDAEPLYKEALEMNRRIFKGDHPDLANSINNMAWFYNGMGNYKDAEPLYKEALEMRRRIFKGDHPDLASSIDNMALFYNGRGNYKDAEPLYNEALGMKRRIFKGDHLSLAISINNMAMFYYNRGNFIDAELLLKEGLEMNRRIHKGDHPELEKTLNNMAFFYEARGNYKDAEPLFKEALEMNRRIHKGDHPDLARTINNMAYFYNGRGNYKDAEPLYKEALEMNRRIFKGDHPDLAVIINNMANSYKDWGNFVEAELLNKEALEMRRRIFKEDHPDLAGSIINMAAFYKDRGNFLEAGLLYKEALEMFRRIHKGDYPDLAVSIISMAAFYKDKGNFVEAEPLYKEALEMYRRIFKGDHPSLAGSINDMASFYNERGNFVEAELLFKEALEMRRRILKGDHPDLALSINSMAGLYEVRGRYTEAEPLFIEGLQVYQNMLNNYFPSLSEKEKKQFWNTVAGSFESFNSFATVRASENPHITCNMYDIQLYSKALLFNSTSKIKSRILNSNDSLLIEKYNIWSEKRDFLVKLYKMSNDELKKKNFNIDSIEKVANDLEKELSLKSEDFKQSYEKKKVTWRSIQTMLKPDEAAVEVVRFRLKKDRRLTDTVLYAFLIVTDQAEEHPELVLLENGNELEKEYYDNYRKHIKMKSKDNESFNRYWKSLSEKIKKYKKIYFSADGIYNKINPATLMMPDGKYLLDIQDIQQVNSTKDIILGYYRTKEESNIFNNAILIGNPNYKLSAEKAAVASRKLMDDNINEQSDEMLVAVRGIELAALPGTEKEIKNIEKFLKSKKWDVKSFLGDMALKTAVSSANNPRILHIATHGLFLEDVKRGGKDIFGFDEQKMVDNPLLRSGLFFSGADNYLKSETPVNLEEDNGLLSAYEAINLNLDKTELVVLSACETGLGDVQNGEGVFGLRRAFQQAGAKTIIMSLWTVSDQATQELMTGFYSNWVSGMPKRQAFAAAQQEVRKRYPDPYFWGAFVMVGE